MKPSLLGVAFAIALAAAAAAVAHGAAQPRSTDVPAGAGLTGRTEAALLDQIRCRQTPRAGRAINAMLKNRLIRYVDNESGVYLFKPTSPLTFLGLKVRHISGFDPSEAFANAPASTMVGTAPPVFLEIDVAAPVHEVRKRALNAGLIEAAPTEDRRGFSVSAQGWASYLATDKGGVTSSIRCVDDPAPPRRE